MLTLDHLHAIVLAKFLWLNDRIEGRLEERKIVFKMMMVKRDHGQRYNPYDYLYDRYPIVVKKLDGYTYELAEIEKTLKGINAMSLGLYELKVIMDLERRLENLPKPDNFDERPPEVTRGASIRDISL
jgi:hypothetical protein